MGKAIGGYFELEIKKGRHFHQAAVKLNTARNGLEYLLRTRQYTKIYLPYYTCEVILEPLKKLGIRYEFYHINEAFEPLFHKELNEGEALLYTNYFGLQRHVAENLAQLYPRLIIDNAQAFFAAPVSGSDTFYSARKFFGVPDGAYVYTDVHPDLELKQDYSFTRMSHLLKRMDYGAEAGYAEFRNNEDALINQQIFKMSELTQRLLEAIDYQEVSEKRKENFKYLHTLLGTKNKLCFDISQDAVPMIYPFYTDYPDLRKKLTENRVYVATYWPNVFEWCERDCLEYKLSGHLLPLPVDQRYGKEDMQYIAEIIMDYGK